MGLSPARIEELATAPGVNTIAVENFLGTVRLGRIGGSERHDDALANLTMDAKLYKWNDATVWAIRKGLADAFSVGPL